MQRSRTVRLSKELWSCISKGDSKKQQLDVRVRGWKYYILTAPYKYLTQMNTAAVVYVFYN